ncbi:transport protein Sec24-like, partial [Thalictrum thalictroides]
MGNEKPEQRGFPGRPSASPFASAPPSAMMPFASSRPVAGLEPSGYGASSQPRFNGPPIPPPHSSYPSSDAGFSPRFPNPQFPPQVQPVPPRGPPFTGQPMVPPPPPSAGHPMASPPFVPPGNPQVMPPPGSYRPQSHIPPVPMRPPPQTMNPFPSRGNTPLPASPPSQPGMQRNIYGQADPVTTYVPSPQAPPYFGHQGGYAPHPPIANPSMISREQMQYSGGPPMGTHQGLVDDFSSLSVGAVPGSIDPGVDTKTLPRPLDGDVEPKAFTEMFPLNCDPRYLRLTTSAIPNSQSLLSRWHLPLGAVVHPLAEAPDGEEVPVVNFGPTGIIRCRRCRTYVNPYVTFTDGGRKWRCNICALLNDVPGDYFSHLDVNGRRTDANGRPELTKGSVEFVAPTEYMVRPPMPPLYFFLIDVSVTAVRSGMLE